LCKQYYFPSSLTASTLKNDGWKMKRIPFKDVYFSGFMSKTLRVYEASFFGRMVGDEIEQSLWFWGDGN